MYLTVLILPLLGSLVAGLLGRKIGVKGAHLITTLCIVLTTILSIFIFIEVGLNHTPVNINLLK
jgi:NADH-ubiquinone oxidoreductase chain 5